MFCIFFIFRVLEVLPLTCEFYTTSVVQICQVFKIAVSPEDESSWLSKRDVCTLLCSVTMEKFCCISVK